MPPIPKLVGRIVAASLMLALATGGPARAHEEPRDQIADVTGLLAVHPHDPALLLRRAQLLGLEGRWPEAAADLNRAAALDPGLAAVDFARGALLLDAGDPGAALASLDYFLAREPENGGAAWLRARGLAARGRRDQAVQQMDRALALLEPGPAGL